MPHHFCIFNFTWFTNLNILDWNKYAEHQLKVQIEVFCSNQFFFSRRALFSCSQQFLKQTQLCLCSQNNHGQIQVLSKVFITWITFGKWICQMVKIKNVLWVVTNATWLCGHPLTDWGDGAQSPFGGKFPICFTANIHEALGNSVAKASTRALRHLSSTKNAAFKLFKPLIKGLLWAGTVSYCHGV